MSYLNIQRKTKTYTGSKCKQTLISLAIHTHLSKEDKHMEEGVQEQYAIWLNGGSVKHNRLNTLEGVTAQYGLDHG